MLPLLSQRLVYIALLHPSMPPLYDATYFFFFLKFREPTLYLSMFQFCFQCRSLACVYYYYYFFCYL